MKIYNFIDEFSVFVKCKHCNKTFKITHEEKTYPANINSFNWGAFTLWRLWGLFNGKILLSLFGMILIFFINIFYVFYVVDLLIGIYLGFRGNKISWLKKEWTSIEKFEMYQKGWNFIGIGCFIFMIFYSVVLIVEAIDL